MIKKKLITVTSAILISAMVLTGCGVGDDTLAKINGKTISISQFNEDYNVMKNSYEAQYGPDVLMNSAEDGRTISEVLKENIVEKLVMEEIIIQKAQKQNIVVTEEELEEHLQSFKEMVGGDEGFNEFLESYGITREYFESGRKKELTFNKYKEKYLEELNVTDKELEEFFNEQKEKNETIVASHILVEDEDEARQILEQIKSGADFSEMASEKSIDPGSAARGGDLGYFGKGQMVPEFEAAAFALNVGEMSDLVETQFGYHIIKIQEESVENYFKEVKFDEKLETLREEAKVEIFMKNIKLDEQQAKPSKDEEAQKQFNENQNETEDDKQEQEVETE